MNKYAVLIGNSQFPDEADKNKLPDLTCPVQDVDGLSKVLVSERGEFDVLPLKNEPSYKILRELQRKLKQATTDDLFLLYYSGHGKPNKSNILHLTTFDTVVAELATSAISMNRIYEILSEAKCRKIVIILDCCYSGAAGQGFKGVVDDQLQQINNARGTYLVTASTELQVAHESAAEGLSLFTKHLIAGLETGEADRDGDGWVSMNELYDYVHEKVVTENPKQHPTEHIKDRRGVYLPIAKTGKIPSKKPSFENLAKEREANKQLEELRKFGFILNEGSAFDPKSGLMWLRFSLGEKWGNGKRKGNPIAYNFDEAIQAIAEFNQEGGYAGYTDWQLPTETDIKTLENKIKIFKKNGELGDGMALFLAFIFTFSCLVYASIFAVINDILHFLSRDSSWSGVFLIILIISGFLFAVISITSTRAFLIKRFDKQSLIIPFSDDYVIGSGKYWILQEVDCQNAKCFRGEHIWITLKSKNNFVTLVRHVE
jgi:hypothetical protein